MLVVLGSVVAPEPAQFVFSRNIKGFIVQGGDPTGAPALVSVSKRVV